MIALAFVRTDHLGLRYWLATIDASGPFGKVGHVEYVGNIAIVQAGQFGGVGGSVVFVKRLDYDALAV